MKSHLNIFLLLLPFLGLSQKTMSAEENVLSKLTEIENNLKGKSSMNAKLPNEIVCLTGIAPKKVDGTYIGIVYWPTLEEVELWRKWITQHHGKFSYYTKFDEVNTEKIIVEYEKGKFRNNYCD